MAKSNTWETAATKSSFEAREPLKTNFSGRQRGEVSGDLYLHTGGFEEDTTTHVEQNGWNLFGVDWFNNDTVTTTTSGYDLIGIKGSEVETMRGSIRSYVKGIDTVLEQTLEASAEEAYKAFRGTEAIAAVNTYIAKVKEYCLNVTSALLAFSDKIADVGNAWISAQSNIAGTVDAATAGFDAGTKYVDDQVTYQGH